jgi:hypothetical protein
VPSNISRKVYLSKGEKKLDFISYYIEESDGSFYLTLLRDGVNNESLLFDNIGSAPEKTEFKKPRPKRKKISYHSSGCVRYHNVDSDSKYFEPISGVSQLNNFCTWSIPDIENLDETDATESEDDYTLDCDTVEGRICFTFCMAPWNLVVDLPHIAIRYNNQFSLIIVMRTLDVELPSEVNDHFLTIAPTIGLFDKQAISNDQALISYHQMVQDGTDIIYSPNGEGVYKVICAVPMRIPPKLGITFDDESLQTEVVKSTNSHVRFKVKDKYGNTIKSEVPILSLFLDSEL